MGKYDGERYNIHDDVIALCACVLYMLEICYHSMYYINEAGSQNDMGCGPVGVTSAALWCSAVLPIGALFWCVGNEQSVAVGWCAKLKIAY